jgi:type II secretory pathway predicted ATPase ExeA
LSLESLPFEDIPDPKYFFDQDYYRRLLHQMMDSLWAGRSFMVVMGPISTRKIAFTQKLMASVTETTRIIWLGEPPETGDELLLFLTRELHINSGSPSKIFLLRDIKEYLLKLHDEGNRCLVIVDEMRKLSDDVLECIRLLNNLEQGNMYTNHFLLESLPFENVPDPAYFFDQGDYRRVFSRLIDSLWAGRGLMVVAGPIGTGKTTMCQKLMVSVSEKTRIIWLGEPPETSEDLLLFITQELHISPESPGRVFVLRDIKGYLLKLHDEGNRCLLIIDEAHKISGDVLECIRLLNNLEQGSIKLIQILLIGQEEFLVKLSRPELISFKQRIAWLEAIGKMTPLQTHEYILHRLKVAGGQAKVFKDDAIEAVAAAAQGTPRLVNTLCDRALRVSYEANKTFVDLVSVEQAADDIGLGKEVFWWLRNRDLEMAKKADLQNLPFDYQSNPDALNPRRGNSANRSVRKHQYKSGGVVNELLDKITRRFSGSPIMQLFISMVLFAASLWFYFVNTRA